MKIVFQSKIVLIVIAALLSIISCTNEFDYGKIQNAVKTLSYNSVTQTTANVSGTIITDNGSTIIERGVCYGTTANPTVYGMKSIDGTTDNPGIGNFSCVIDGLNPSTTYYARAYATNSYGTAYGTAVVFTTLQATVPILSITTAANLITPTSAKTGGNITNSGASTIISRGVCYSSTSTIPTIANTKTNDGNAIGNFISSLTGLSPNTIYYIRAYATNGIGTGYGDVKSFMTNPATIPSGIITTNASNINLTTASSGGTIADNGGAVITTRGVCWSSTNLTPTILNTKTVDGTGIGSYSSALTGLIPGTTYYVRAYATNNVGTAYGNVINFTTIAATAPTGVTTNILSLITQNTATCGGSVSTDGGATVTSRGVCWNTSANPTILNTKTIDGTGTGSFTSSLTGLTPNTTYYVRAYATNSIGTTYGSTKILVTTAATIPTGITTAGISAISQNTASSGGTIAGSGGATISSRGVCWSTSTSTPTISNTKTIDGTGTGTFTSSLTGLTANTTYYVRAYATNSVGTAYGNTQTFTTLANLAVGQSYQGGVIAYIFVSGDSGYVTGQTHGLITSNTSTSTGAQWGCSGTSISGTSTTFGTGLANTTAIVNGCSTTTIAAAVCFNLSSGGYSDWYLPSKDELNKLYLNKLSIGGFSNVSYWSSSQTNSTTAWSINFSTGASSSTSTKSTSMYVRAIRKF